MAAPRITHARAGHQPLPAATPVTAPPQFRAARQRHEVDHAPRALAHDASWRAEANRLTSSASARTTSAVKRPTPRQLGEHFDLRAGTGRAGGSPSPAGQSAPAPRRSGPGNPRPARGTPRAAGARRARPGPVPAGRRVMPVVRTDGADPVAQPHQIDPVPQQRPQLADGRWGDPGFGGRSAPQQLSQDRRVGRCRSSASPRRSPSASTRRSADPDGVSVFRTREIRLAQGAPLYRGQLCPHCRSLSPAAACHIATASP
jgi:hypothetical protein